MKCAQRCKMKCVQKSRRKYAQKFRLPGQNGTGREEGRIQGIIATGTLLGISKEQILKILCTQMSITKEQAEDYLEQEQHAAL